MDAMTLHRKQRLRALIDAKPYKGSQAALAAVSGVSEGRISQMLDLALSWGERSAKKLALTLGLDPRYFEQGFEQAAEIPGQPAKAPHPDPIVDRLLNAYEVLDAQERIALTESAERVAAEKLGRELLAKKMGVKNFSPTSNERVARHYGSPKNKDKGKT